jgi:hypothetical protein
MDYRGVWVRFTAGVRNFLYSTASRPVVWPTHPPIRGIKSAGAWNWPFTSV